MGIAELIIAAGVPSAITGFAFWMLEHQLSKRDAADADRRKKRQKEIDEREKIREEKELCIINSINASLALGEATAKAVQRIPDAHCNGDMHDALKYAARVKHEQKDFLLKQGIKNILEDD